MVALCRLRPIAWQLSRASPWALSGTLESRQQYLRRWAVAPISSHAHASLATRSSGKPALSPGLRIRLDLRASQLIDEHQHALRSVLKAVQAVPEATTRDVGFLQKEVGRLGDGFFMLVVAGEFNSGKSTLVNALIRRNVLPEGPTPTTARVTKLRYADESRPPFEDIDGVVIVCEPVPVLANRLQIVDTPGTNAIDRKHEALTKDFLPLCDIVLFVTSADRPFSESERLFLESIRTWGKKVILIVNKMDLLDTDEAKAEVMDFVSSSARSLVGNDSKVFALSARLAKQAKDRSQSRTDSGVHLLEEFINDTLDSIERLRLKLQSSASLGATVSRKYMSVLTANQAIVNKDKQTIRDIEDLLHRHEETIRKGYPGHFARVENVLLDVLNRADVFFDSHVRISNQWNLSNRAVMEQTFEDEVIKGIEKFLQREVREVAEWLADLTSRNLTETTAIFSRRIGERAKEISTLHDNQNREADKSSLEFPGLPSGKDFEFIRARERLLSKLSESCDDVSGFYISRKESKRFADQIANAARLSTFLGLGAAGSLSGFLMNSSSLAPAVLLGDPTLPILACIIGALGIAAVPRQRLAIRAELKSRMNTARSRLRHELHARLDEHLAAHVSGIHAAIEPFSQYSENENKQLEKRIAAIKSALNEVLRLEDKLLATEMLSIDEDSEKR